MLSQSYLGRELTQRDLISPLLSSTARDAKDDATAASDEESNLHKYYDPSDHEEDDAPPDETPTRLRSLRTYRKLLTSEWEKWGRPAVFVKYLVYLAFAALVSANQVNPHKFADFDEQKPYVISGTVLYIIFALLSLVALPVIAVGRRQLYAWGGLYTLLLYTILYVLTVNIFSQALQDNQGMDNILLVSMALALFIEKRFVDPEFQKLYWYYHGAASAEEVDEKPPLSGIGAGAVKKIAVNACAATGIRDEATEKIVEVLDGLKIRGGETDEEDVLDDWTLIIYKLSKVVSFAPFAACRSASAVSTVQFRNLVCQMIIYMRQYMDTGRIEQDETTLKRTAPLSFFEAIAIMTRFALQVPGPLVLAVVPRTLQVAANAAVMPYAIKFFLAGLYPGGDKSLGRIGFGIIIMVTGISPLLSILASVVESNFSSRMIAKCRSKMFDSLMKGGTRYDETHRPGAVIDAFSNHLTQVLLFGQTFYITLIPNIVGLLAGVCVSGLLYPFAVVLFVSIVPIVLSVDHFLRKASKASTKKAQMETKAMGKINSAVECRRAIRASDAGRWVTSDMKDMFESLRVNARLAFLRSNLASNFLECSAAVFTVLVLVPLGIQVLDGKMDVSDFMGVSTALTALIMPFFLLGQAQSNTMIYSGSILSVKDLMDNSLDEEPAKKPSSAQLTTLSPLRDSLKTSGVKFRYSASTPDVLKGVEFDINKGTYTVICGESGSGKTTALNLLMRFYKPYEGSIKWDGTDIYKTTLGSFRENVSVMFQQTMIYQATIRDNILFGLDEVPGGVEKAAQDAEISEVIERLPDGYDTVIGGDAVAGMSGGQLQRICMARALYRKPSLLLLDEATSALDKETEHAIIETLVNLRDKSGLTIVSVSHHPETAIKANKVVVLAQGVLAEEGTYEELSSLEGGIFKRIVEAGE